MSENSPEEIIYKSPESLLADGGKFYTMGGEFWCDTPLDSWRLISGKGYIRDAVDNLRAQDEQEVGG